ncbi:PLD nuclease N-terminal domain-containing protein [Nesterenkonia halophila]|uniref:PLD nuclease N-terminal domain-containing protein n=1 Tax=Nesterenkonia halophila TaxID=302044 RepID=UPI001478814E|nr:PLD nuclease N-terminal domain-containing protein [Nesterenkonia halophila]
MTMTDLPLLVLTAAQDASGDVVAPWWLRIGLIAAGMLALAAVMALIQARHPPARAATWAVIIVCVPLLGPLAYFVVETIRYRRDHPHPTRGRAERSVTEDDDGDEAAGGAHGR